MYSRYDAVHIHGNHPPELSKQELQIEEYGNHLPEQARIASNK